MAEKALPGWFLPTLMRFIWWIGDRFFVDPVFCPTLNRFRAELGLPPVTRLFETWIHEGDVLVGLFPDWFATPPLDWPPKVKLTSFPLYDAGTSVELPRDVEHFLEAGSRPVVFTAGSAAAWEAAFFEESVEACRLAGKRGVLLTRYRQQIPSALPDGVAHFPYVPFSRILPRAEALVHHGGIGTVSQALAAGTPQLVRPLAFDQFDNARRVSRLGAGRTLASKDYRAETVAAALCSLEDHGVRAATSRAVRLLDGVDGAADTCDLILKELR